MTATLAILALAAANSSAPAGPAAPVQAPDPVVGSSALGTTQAANEDLLLFSVQLDGTTISEALTAYGDPADPLLPLGELTRLLELPLDIDVANGVASGRIGEGQRPITIDLRSGQALIGGKVVALIPPDSLVSETDIYLRASLVAKLLPLKITSIADEMILTLEATEKLPLQAQRERLARMAGLAGQPETQDDAMRVATPYRWASAPAFDFTTELGYNSEGVNGGGRAVTRFEGRVAGDLLKAGFNAWIATDDHGDPVSARLAFTRRSEEGRLLGSLGGTSAALGDVFTPPHWRGGFRILLLAP